MENEQSGFVIYTNEKIENSMSVSTSESHLPLFQGMYIKDVSHTCIQYRNTTSRATGT